MTASAETLREAREAAGLSAREAAALVGVTTLTWQRWEGQSSRTTEIPYAHWNLFLLLTGSHPIYRLEPGLTEQQFADVREQCAEIVQAIRADALSKMWA